jgi:hypothetical protein
MAVLLCRSNHQSTHIHIHQSKVTNTPPAPTKYPTPLEKKKRQGIAQPKHTFSQHHIKMPPTYGCDGSSKNVSNSPPRNSAMSSSTCVATTCSILKAALIPWEDPTHTDTSGTVATVRGKTSKTTEATTPTGRCGITSTSVTRVGLRIAFTRCPTTSFEVASELIEWVVGIALSCDRISTALPDLGAAVPEADHDLLSQDAS